jgi:hypothetical protein
MIKIIKIKFNFQKNLIFIKDIFNKVIIKTKRGKVKLLN